MTDPNARCRWCGKTYAQHTDELPKHLIRTPCMGTKAYFLERFTHHGAR